MREILFRGKRTIDGEWICGGLFVYPEGECSIGCAGSISDNFFVSPKTVGQYTGLTDKNGVKIFEGDIVKGKVNTLYGYRVAKAGVIYDTVRARFAIKYYGESKNIPFECEIIGNIYDNPELLKGGE